MTSSDHRPMLVNFGRPSRDSPTTREILQMVREERDRDRDTRDSVSYFEVSETNRRQRRERQQILADVRRALAQDVTDRRQAEIYEHVTGRPLVAPEDP